MKNTIIFLLAIQMLACSTPTTEKPNTEITVQITGVTEKDRNIYAVYSNEAIKQLTTYGSDHSPIYNEKENKVLFVRDKKERGKYRDYIRKQILTMDIDTKKEHLVTETKPYKDGLDATNQIIKAYNPTFTSDYNDVYFITEKAATSNQLVKVNIRSGQWTELFSAESFEILPRGEYKGAFLIGRSETRYEGRMTYHILVNEAGEVLKEFETKEKMDKFSKEQSK